MKKISYILILVLMQLLPSLVKAQTVLQVPTTYATITAAYAAIPATITGAYVIQINAGYTGAGETYPIVLSSRTGSSASNTITIRPSVTGVSITSANATGTVNIDGGDYIIIDGRVNGTGSTIDMTVANTSTTGYAVQLINDATNNTIQYSYIKGVNTTTTEGVVLFSTTSGSTGNDYNTIDNCDLGKGATNPNSLVYSAGTSGKENNNNTVSNSNLHDFLYVTNGLCTAIDIESNNHTWTISNNSFYQPTAFAATAIHIAEAIRINNTSGYGFTVTNNYIGGQSALCGGSPWTVTGATFSCIYAIYMNTASTSVSTVQGNTIKNIDFTFQSNTSLTFAFIGIYINNGYVDCTSNNIGTSSATGSILIKNTSTLRSAIFGGIVVATSYKGSIQSNIIGGITISYATTTVEFDTYGIYFVPTITSAVSIIGNTIGSATTANSIQTTGANNPTSEIIGIACSTAGGAFTVTVSGNTISNLFDKSTSTSAFAYMEGISVGGTGANYTVTGNTLSNLSTATSSATALNLQGIVVNTTVAGTTVSNNLIYTLTCTASAASVPYMYGIVYSGATTGTNVIEANFIHNLYMAGAGNIGGLVVSAGTATVKNNMIQMGLDNAGASIAATGPVYGIFLSSSSAVNLYFNSVYLGGAASSGSNNTYAFIRTATATNTFRNNILYNARSGGTGKHYAISINANSSFTSNYNDLYVTANANNLGSYDAGVTARTFAVWKTNTTQDANSINADPSYVTPAGTSSTADLHITAGSPCIGVGIAGTGVLIDYDSQTRATGVNPNGPCIGADERPVTSGTNAYGVYSPGALGGNVTSCEIYATGGPPGGIGLTVAQPTSYGYTSVPISGYPVITAENYNCLNTDIDFTSAAGATPFNWTSFGTGSTPSSASATQNPNNIQYTTTGRKDIVEAQTYYGFVNIILTPPSPGTVNGTTNVCPGSYTFSSSLAGSPGYTYAWSVLPAGATITSPTASSTSITLPNATGANITYTVTCTVTSDCCGPLTAVTYNATIYPATSAPTAAAPGTPCPGGSVVLNATAPASASFAWYTAATGGTLLGSGSTYTVNPVASGTTNYYLEATSTNGCVSPRTTVAVTSSTPTVPTTTGASSCGADFVTVSVTSLGAGYTYNWYTGSCGGTLVQSSTSTAYTAYTSATTTYYVTAAAPGCSASTCATVTATINTPPATITWLGVSGGTNNWFTTANWTSGCLPTCVSDVVIVPNGGTVVAQPDIGFNATANAACKSINLQSGTTLSFSDPKAELDVCGNFTHSGTLTTNNMGFVVFMGSTMSQTYTRTGTGSFNDVILFNTFSTPTLTLNNDMTLGTVGNFTFQNGRVITGSNNLIITNPTTSSVSGHASTRYVQGNLRRYINSTGSYDFPVGHATKLYQLVNVNFTTATTISYLTANFQTYGALPGALGSTECVATYNQNALDNGFWQIDANNTPNNTGVYNMTCYNTNYTNAAAGWTVMSRHNGSATWGLLNGDGSTSTCVPSPVTAVVRNGMKGFSYFGIAQSSTILPIELLSFEATYNGSSVDVKWATSSEYNNHYFNVERSVDGENFQSISTVDSKAPNGNSNYQINYGINDPDVKPGVYYYRLKQTDYNGAYKHSSIETVTIGADSDVFNVVPNPTTNQAEINYRCYASESASLKVYDTRGRLIISRDINCSKGRNSSNIDLTEYQDGIYFITLSTGNRVYKTKLLKHND